MTTQANDVVETSELAGYINTIYKNYKVNRQDLEKRWAASRAAADVSLELDEYGVWDKSERAENHQSSTFVDVTRQKIAAAKAIVSDAEFKGAKVQFMLVTPAQAISGDTPDAEDRDEIVKANERYIARQLENCDAVTELGRCVMSGATFGRYFAKRYTRAMEQDGFDEVADNVFIPHEGPGSMTTAFERKSVFSMYWDRETDDLKTGEAVIEKDYVSPWMLNQSKKKPFHFDIYIDQAIKLYNKTSQDSEISDDNKSLPTKLRAVQNRTRTIRTLEYWGRVPRIKAEAFEAMLEAGDLIEAPDRRHLDDTQLDAADMVEIFAIMADDQIIAYRRTDDPTERPYYMADWEEVLDGSSGRGIADNLHYITKTLNGAVRTLEDNMKLTSKLILAMKRSGITEDPEKEFASDKRIITLTLDEESNKNVAETIQQLKLDSMITPLTELINMFLEFADMSSNIPRAEQGQQSVNAQTAFELQQRLARSGKYMAEVIKRLDEFIEKIINDMYRYNMLDPDLPIPKGVYKVRALGFSSFENVIVRLNKLMQFFGLVISNPVAARKVNLDWLVEEIAKAMDMDADQLFKSDEQMQAESDAAANSPEAKTAELEVAAKAAEIEKTQSEINKDNSDIAKNDHDMLMDEKKADTERAKVVAEITTKAQEAKTPQESQ